MNRKATDIVLMGFAYSLASDGSPGAYNEELARIIKEDIEALRSAGAQPWFGMQWEICDALLKLAPHNNVPDSHVAAPPPFNSEDITNADAMVELLRKCPTKATEILWKELEKDLNSVGYTAAQIETNNLGEKESAHKKREITLDRAGLNAAKLALYLNRILQWKDFFKNFYEDEGASTVCRVELHDLYQTSLGSVGVENRTMPLKDADLGYFQTRRVNRLIIEAIFPHEGILERMPYLSTYGVIRDLLPQIEQELPGIGNRKDKCVIVYGHPEHRGRCKRQFIECAWSAGWNIQPDRVLIGGKNEQIRINTTSGPIEVSLAQWDSSKAWDPNSAQMWCRSKRNWDDYEAMGTLRLH
jgi:hypothetical protein